MRLVNLAKDLIARARAAPTDRKLWVGIVAVVLAGVWLRSVRFWIDPIGLWGDEACWVFKLFNGPLTRGSSRPIGITVVTYLLTEYGLNDERTLRLLPQLASLGTLVVFPYVGKQLLRSLGTTLFMTVVVAFHPLLIDFSKEFKPYAVEVFVHLWLVACVLRYRETRRVSTLAVLLGSAFAAFLFAYNVVFLYPSLFLVVWHQDLMQHRRLRLALSVSVAAATFALVLGVALTLFGRVEQEASELGKKIFLGKGNCYTCHGQNLKGTVLAPDLTDSTWQHGDGSLQMIENTIRTGVAKPINHPAPMPAMGGAKLSPANSSAIRAIR